MKKILKYVLCLFSIFVPLIVKADKIYNIDMHVNINKNGEAYIEEIWDVKADSGSEWYKYYANMENIELSNYEVYMDGKLLNYKTNWNINESIKDKDHNYGIHYKNNGYELCFGKSDFKKHTFILKYKLSNVIFNVDDAQVLYFTFLPRITVDNYNIIIDSYYEFPDTLDVWGYGAKGYAYVENGRIKMSNEGKVNNNYVTLLVKFPQNTFDILNNYNKFKTFNDVFTMAEKGTYDYDYDNNYIPSTSNSTKKENYASATITLILNILFYVFLIFLFVKLARKLVYFGTLANKFNFEDDKKIDPNDIAMFNEIPCNHDIYYANALVKINDFNYSKSNVLGAILLKWLKENKIKIVIDKNDPENITKMKIDMTNGFIPDENTQINEMKLFSFMYSYSEKGILKISDINSLSTTKKLEISSVVDDIVPDETKKLEALGYIYIYSKIKGEKKFGKYMVDELYEESKKLYGLKLFLESFSRGEQKEKFKVELWSEYLMFACLFGIEDNVIYKFKDCPDIIKNMKKDNISFEMILFINEFFKSIKKLY